MNDCCKFKRLISERVEFDVVQKAYRFFEISEIANIWPVKCQGLILLLQVKERDHKAFMIYTHKDLGVMHPPQVCGKNFWSGALDMMESSRRRIDPQQHFLCEA